MGLKVFWINFRCAIHRFQGTVSFKLPGLYPFVETALVGISCRLLSKSIVAMGEASRSQRIVWVDCEMTGLDVSSKTIVEIACVVTEADLTVTIVEFFKFKDEDLKFVTSFRRRS